MYQNLTSCANAARPSSATAGRADHGAARAENCLIVTPTAVYVSSYDPDFHSPARTVIHPKNKGRRSVGSTNFENERDLLTRSAANKPRCRFVAIFEQLYSSPSDRERKQTKTIYNKHRNKIGTLDYQAVTHV